MTASRFRPLSNDTLAISDHPGWPHQDHQRIRRQGAARQEAEREAGDGKDEFAEYVAILVRAGWSTGDIVHAVRLTQLSDDEFEETVAETVRGYERASRTAFANVYRPCERQDQAKAEIGAALVKSITFSAA
jgi:hypothetical protein